MDNDLIPVNVEGKPSDLEFSATLTSIDEARLCYRRAVKRLQNPALWHELAGWASASFELMGEDREELSRLVLEGDFIRIDVPGPGPVEGGGYDWVRVEKMEEYVDPGGLVEWTGMKVRPCSSPGSEKLHTAHFFRSDASSTFVIERNGNRVKAFYYGRNELPNTATSKLGDNVRNALVAAGAIFHFSEVQWSALSKGLLAEEIGAKVTSR